MSLGLISGKSSCQLTLSYYYYYFNSGLPGPTYPALADPYHGERPCSFSPDGTTIATGAEDGSLQIWDTNGAQVNVIQN